MDQVFVQEQQMTFIFLMKIEFAKQTELLKNTEALMESLKLTLPKNLRMRIRFYNMFKIT